MKSYTLQVENFFHRPTGFHACEKDEGCLSVKHSQINQSFILPVSDHKDHQFFIDLPTQDNPTTRLQEMLVLGAYRSMHCFQELRTYLLNEKEGRLFLLPFD